MWVGRTLLCKSDLGMKNGHTVQRGPNLVFVGATDAQDRAHTLTMTKGDLSSVVSVVAPQNRHFDSRTSLVTTLWLTRVRWSPSPRNTGEAAPGLIPKIGRAHV